ncbi:MAG: ABC transporter permease [Chloroflexi bacterium]|nr:ABC transporter permease [Chloroflexota bacterium]MCL5075295.1 ABC transporter permease [Chloroflexota bacterium]
MSVEATPLGQDQLAKYPLVIIKPTRGWRLLDLKELWEYRELIYFLTLRDIKVRYKQTLIGIGWAILQPLGMMLVFTIFFGTLAKIPSEGVPYPLFVYTALLPWQLFSKSISESSQSLITDQRLITRVYFPRLIVPLSSVLAGLLDFAIGLLLLAGLMVLYGVIPTVGIAFIPLLVLLMLAVALGIGFWLSALNLEYRDVQYVVPFLNQFWLFITPVVYGSSMIPQQWRIVYALNPMVGVIEGFRWALLSAGECPGLLLAVSGGIAFALLVSGVMFFRRRERTFVDAVG